MVIARPIDEVVAFMEDLDNVPAWMEHVSGTEVVSGQPHVEGVVYRQHLDVLGVSLTYESELVSYASQDHQEFLIEVKGLEIRIRFEVGAVAGGTEVSQRVNVEATGRLGRMAVPVAERIITRVVDSQLAALKDVLEAG